MRSKKVAKANKTEHKNDSHYKDDIHRALWKKKKRKRKWKRNL